MNRYRVTVNHKEFDVLLHGKINSVVKFEIEGSTYEVEVAPKLSPRSVVTETSIPIAPPSKSSARSAPSGSADKVVAPMPGIVVSIAVSPGEQVKRGALLCVIEAMKMENNIISPRDGAIKEILITPGQELDNGQLLITFE